MKTKPPNSTHALIRKMGGHKVIAPKLEAITGIKLSYPSLYQWGVRERIPPMWVSYLVMAFPMFASAIHQHKGK